MPELNAYMTALIMHAIYNLFPAINLLLIIDAGRGRITHRLCGYLRAFSDNQACTGALGVIFGHQLIGEAFFAGSRPGHGGEDDAIAQFQAVQVEGGEELRHGPRFVDRAPVAARGANRLRCLLRRLR